MLSLPLKRPNSPLLLAGLCLLLLCLLIPWPMLLRSSALHSSPPPASGPADAFQTLQAAARGPLQAHWDAQTGVPDFLAGATPAVRLPYLPTSAERGNPEALALGFLEQNRTLFQLGSAKNELRLARIEPDPRLGYSHVRLNQVYQGLAVFGKQLIVHVDAEGQIAAVNGSFVPGINLPVEPRLSRSDAEQVALRDLLEARLQPFERERAQPTVLHPKTQLLIYVDERGHPSLTWRVTVLTASPLGQWYFFVNARRPLVMHAYDGSANEKVRLTHTAQNSTNLPGRLIIREGERSRDAVAQAAHDAAGRVYDYYFNNFERDSIDGQGSPIVSTVHFGNDPEDAENAAWIGELQQIIYGDGGRIFRPLAYGLDVAGHEITHGVIDNTAQLIYEGQSGALNESYADVFGALIEGNNWIMGEEVVKSPPYPLSYLRSLEDPNAEGNYDPNNPLGGVGQPASMDEYANLPLSRRYDNGGVHINSGIPNRAAFLVAQALGNDKMQQIYYRTMTQFLSPDSDFGDAARSTVRAAQELYGATEAQAVTQAFNQVGIQVGEAPPTAPQPDETVPDPNAPQDPTDQLPEGCSDIVVNGGFESDDGWTEVTGSDAAILDPELPYQGRRSAWLGGIDEESLQYVWQDVAIPANAARVELSYFRLIHQETRGGLGGLLAAEADFTVLIANNQGEAVRTLEELSSAQGDDTWQQATHDLSQFAGKRVRLVFAAQNPPNNVSSFFVDEVVLAVCTTGQGPRVPQPTSDDDVYIQGTIDSVDTGRGIAGAQILIIRPELSASDAVADDTLTEDEVLTLGTTDNNGQYQTEEPVPRGQTYSVVIIANGYRPIVADGELQIPDDAENPFPVDASMRRGR